MKRLAILAIVAVFVAALVVLHAELARVHLADVTAAFRAIPASAFALAFALTVASYLVLTGYDVLALRYVGRPLPYPRVAAASFIAYAVGHNLGLAMLTGGSVRYRLYSRAGLSALEVGKVVAACTLTFGLGVAAVLALVAVLAPEDLTAVVGLGPALARGIGLAGLGVLAAYLVWNTVRRAPVEIRGVRVPLPGLGMTLAQLVLAAADMALASAVLYVLLPSGTDISFASFLGLYVVALVAAIASHVPGGLGVFEAVMVAAAPGVAADTLLASILAYRVLYYLAPLAVAAAILAAHELAAQAAALRHLARRGADMLAGVAPRALGAMVFASGAILVLSGATPPLADRVRVLAPLVPIGLLEASHMVASVAGLGLLVLARGLLLRLDAAWGLTVVLMLVGAVASIAKGLDWEEATIVGVVLVALVSGRREFYRKAALGRLQLGAGWIGAVALVLIGCAWLGVFSYKHVEFSSELWWQFAVDAEAPRALRAFALVAIGAVVIGTWALLRPMRAEPGVPDLAELDRALGVVRTDPSSRAWLVMTGDKRLLFDEPGETFLMYGVQGRSWIAMGDPVGPESGWEELLWTYRELVDRHAGRAVFYEIAGAHLPYYLDLGLQASKLGERARIALAEFSLEGPRRGDLRTARSRAQRDGATFEVLPAEAVEGHLPVLKAVSDDWLAHKRVAEKSFSVGRFSPSYLRRLPCAVVRRDDQIVAFANLLPGGGLQELSVDLMRYGAAAPKGVMDYLFAELLLWGRAQGYRWFDLGMAPLAGLETHPLAPSWHRVGAFVFHHAEHFYNFEGLRAYKAKFDPVWEPRYLAAPGGLATARALLDASVLIAGGVRRTLAR